jgi:hypothetical protein
MEYGTIDTAYTGRMATIPPGEDGPIWMVNFMKYREWADFGEAGGPAISGREADDRYAPVEVLASLGAEIAYFGDVVTAEGRPDPAWDRMAVVRYPTRRSFIDMVGRPDFQAQQVHKDAGMERSIILACLPLDRVSGTPDADGAVWFTAYPAGAPDRDPWDDGAPFVVEGTVVGDERRWARLTVSWAPPPGPELPEGALVVRTMPHLDRIDPLVDEVLVGG